MDSMLSKALRGFVSGPLNQLLVNLAGEQGYLWEEEFKRFLRKEPCWGERILPQTFRLVVDYDLSLDEMVAAGRYNEANTYDLELVQDAKGKREMEARYFHFNRRLSTEDARVLIATEDSAHPWTPASLSEILSHGATNPEEQRKYRIIGLTCAPVDDQRWEKFPCLGGGGRKRQFWSRNNHRMSWRPADRFLAVREIKS